jgi:hypothetical protein
MLCRNYLYQVKNTFYYIILFALFVVGFIACNKARGPVGEHEIVIDPIVGIELAIRDNVYISQGTSQRIIIEAQENVVEVLNKEVKNGIWKIYFEDKPAMYKNMKISITLPELQYISLTGPGIVLSKTLLTCDSISLNVSGSGNIDVDANVRKLECNMTGKGDIYLKGTCEKQYINISGSGRVSSFDMQTTQCIADIPGEGIADVSVSEKLNVHISGSGNVNYYGNPELNTSIEGTGTVTKIR